MARGDARPASAPGQRCQARAGSWKACHRTCGCPGTKPDHGLAPPQRLRWRLSHAWCRPATRRALS